MEPQARRFCMLAALLLALATLVGALGAHALKPRLTADHYEVLQTAVLYQFLHSLGLLGLGLLSDRLRQPLLHLSAWFVFAGVILFSGSLYLLLCGAPRLLGVLTPLGGLCLIGGWCLAAMALLRWRAA
jgi:uncharacterized membrane protein YgdD (TMEM256/DUF423 family)